MDEQAIRALARKNWDGQRTSKGQTFAEQVDAYLSSIPLEGKGMTHCPTCKGIACGVCGRCHEDDQLFVAFLASHCPAATPNNERSECLPWSYAYHFLLQVQRAIVK